MILHSMIFDFKMITCLAAAAASASLSNDQNGSK